MIIGLTGGIGSGKTTVAEMLKKYGFYYIDGDEIGREVLQTGHPAYIETVKNFGESILNDDRSINRRKLGDIVFSSPQKLLLLNSITHRYIFERIKDFVGKTSGNIVIEAAPIFEIGIDKLTDEVWFLDCDENIRIERIMERNNYTYSQAKARVDAQDTKMIKSKSSRIIYNNDFNELKQNVLHILAEIKFI